MKRRRLIAIISLCTLAAIGILAVIGGVVVMRTDLARNFVQARLAGAINGSVYLGRISGNPFSGLTIDTVAIRDVSGELVVSTGPVSFDYDIRDLADQRIYLRHVVAERPHVHLRQHADGSWNYKRLMKSSGGPRIRTPARSWGDFVVVDSARIIDGSYFLSLRWAPDDTLRPAARDSVIRDQLSRKDRVVRKTADGYARTYMWTSANGLLAHGRFADPDSNRFGIELHVADLDANEFDPPFNFRNLRGRVRKLGDSAWLDISHWDLPGSTGSARGKLVWGSDLPIRYDIVVRGDSMSLADVNWVYPTLPKTGGGSMLLRISNRRNLRVMDYHLDSMDVRSTGSRLIGEMTFGVGGPLLQILDVNLRAQPLDFALIKALNGKPFPIDWRGQITGDVRAPGGPVDDFDVTSARGEWRDTNVPGAVSRLSGSGGLDIQYPAFTAFKDFDVNVQTLDLRSITHLFPAFPKLQGTIAGSATLDSVWTDVRFSNADITHRDGPGTPSRFTGSGRVTDGSPFVTYDVDLQADPLSFDMLARSFPGLTLSGLAYGPIRISGQSPSLDITTNLVTAAGGLRFAGNIDIDSLGGYGARGEGEIRGVDLSRLGVRADAPVTSLSGRYTVDLRGSTPASLSGLAQIRLDSSVFSNIVLDSLSTATIRFDQGRAITSDSLIINSPMGRITAFGAIGLPAGGSDSIRITLALDSLGKTRPFFAADGTPTPADSLAGAITVQGVATGRLDSLFIRGGIAGENLYIRGLVTDRLAGTFAFADALRSPSGSVALSFDTVAVGGLRFDTATANIAFRDSTNARFVMSARMPRADSLTTSAEGSWSRLGPTTTARLDAFILGFGDSRWSLAQPATVVFDSTALSIDSLALRNGAGGSIDVAGSSPARGEIDFRLAATNVPLLDINRVLGQVNAPVNGLADLAARMRGTRDAPVIEARTALDSIAISDVQIGRLIGSARYADNRASARAEIFQGDKRVLDASADSLPLAVRWLSYDTLPGRVRFQAVADTADFTLIQAWVPNISNVTGKLSGRLSMDGTWSRPNLIADASLTDGGLRIDTLGIALSRMYSSVRFTGDTLTVDSLRIQSGGESNTALLQGRVAFRDWFPSWFDLRMDMNNFLAYDRSELATIYARTNPGNPIRLTGPITSDTLVGQVYVDRGAIYLPDPKMPGKRFSTLDSLGFILAAPREKTLYERVTDSLWTNLTARIGGSFKLSAEYADIPLTGDLSIVPVAQTDVARRSDDYISRLAPVGTINADRGTYTLLVPPIFSKTFQVERGGTITFDRDAQWNGQLNVSARYVVRRPGQPEVPIVIDVTDRLLTPRVKPRSEASFPISESDLISYIVFDQPGFDVIGQTAGGAAGRSALAASLFTPIATSATSDLIRRQVFGGWPDQFRFETSSLDQNETLTTSLLAATRLSVGKELVEGRLYLSLSAGLCGFDQTKRANQGFGESFAPGANLDYRLESSLTSGATWQFATEPSTLALRCSSGYSVSQGIAPTPRQYSLSFLKFWRW